MAWADPSRGLLLIYLTQSRGQNTRNDFLRLIYAALFAGEIVKAIHIRVLRHIKQLAEARG